MYSNSPEVHGEGDEVCCSYRHRYDYLLKHHAVRTVKGTVSQPFITTQPIMPQSNGRNGKYLSPLGIRKSTRRKQHCCVAVSGCLIKLSSVVSVSCGLSDAQSVSQSDGGSAAQLILGFWWFSLSLPVASPQAAGVLLAYPLASLSEQPVRNWK